MPQVLAQKLGRSVDGIIKLDANENPYGPPAEVRAALGAMRFPHIYPDPECRALRAKLAELTGTPAENLLVGCGADELIDLLLRCIVAPGDCIVDCPPTFTMYAFDADVNDGRVVTVPRLDGFRLDVPGIRAAVLEHKPKAVFLTSPNNPDGSMIAEAELLELLRLPVLVVLDEAYIEFSDEATRMPWVTSVSNLVVLRTFSKSAGLAGQPELFGANNSRSLLHAGNTLHDPRGVGVWQAEAAHDLGGLRIGYGAFPSDLIKYVWRAKQPYNVAATAEVAALAALANPTYMRTVRDLLVAERRRLHAELESLPFLRPYPSESNFILCKVDGRDAKQVKDTLANEYGIMVRHYAKKELSGYIRISVGKPEHTDKLMQALRSMT